MDSKTLPNELLLGSFSNDTLIQATSNGLIIKYKGANSEVNLGLKSSWQRLEKITRQGALFVQSLDQFLQLGLVECDSSDLRIAYADLKEFSEVGYDLFDELIPWAPFSIYVGAKGVLGTSSFEPNYKFVIGRQQSFPIRVGPFLSRAGVLYRLSPSHYELVEEIEKFNLLPAESKTKERSLLCLNRIKTLTNGEKLDEYLDGEGVLIPQRVSIGILSESEGFISLYPIFDGVPAEAMRAEFFRLSEVQTVYDLQSAHGKRIRVLMPEGMVPVLKDLQRIRRIGGSLRDRIVADVMSCFSDGVNRNLIDVSDFAPRVRGICSVPQRSRLLINIESRNWSGVDEDDEETEEGVENSSADQVTDKPIILHVETDQGSADFPFSFRAFRIFASRVAEALAQDSAQLEYKKRLVLISEDLLEQIRQTQERVDRRRKEKLTSAKR